MWLVEDRNQENLIGCLRFLQIVMQFNCLPIEANVPAAEMKMTYYTTLTSR
jgi:hypothetical protein